VSKFKIGQRVVCLPDLSQLPVDSKSQWSSFFNDVNNERLVVGETYDIEDIDIHFPGKICVKLKGPYYFHYEFVPEEFFTDDKSVVRNEKINQIIS
jgi:hypothetical protein